VDVKESDLLGDAIDSHWYYRAKAVALLDLLGNARHRVVADIGAGSGFFARTLLARGVGGTAWCIDTAYTASSDLMLPGGTMHFRPSPEGAPPADLVLLMDVLEHVDDDVALLADCVQRSHHDARFVVSVPAFQWLWSNHDVFLEHRRRYSLRQIEAVVRAAGLVPQRGHYFYATVLAPAVLQRLLDRLTTRPVEARSQLRQHSPLVNQALLAACQLERPWARFNRAFGLTAFVLARRECGA